MVLPRADAYLGRVGAMVVRGTQFEFDFGFIYEEALEGRACLIVQSLVLGRMACASVVVEGALVRSDEGGGGAVLHCHCENIPVEHGEENILISSKRRYREPARQVAVVGVSVDKGADKAEAHVGRRLGISYRCGVRIDGSGDSCMLRSGALALAIEIQMAFISCRTCRCIPIPHREGQARVATEPAGLNGLTHCRVGRAVETGVGVSDEVSLEIMSNDAVARTTGSRGMAVECPCAGVGFLGAEIYNSAGRIKDGGASLSEEYAALHFVCESRSAFQRIRHFVVGKNIHAVRMTAK